MADRLEELAVAGYLNDEARSQLRNLDVDAVHSIGLAGPLTPELVLKTHDLGAERVAEFAHELAAGPFDPNDFEELMEVGIDEVRATIFSAGLSARDPSDVLALIRREYQR